MDVDGEIPPFDVLYRDHFGFVYACLLRLGVPDASIDDAAQDVFVTVHRRSAGFEGKSTLRSWLFGIVRRVAFRHRRSAQRAATKLRALADDAIVRDGTPVPVDSIELAQRSALLLRALDRLDDDKRAALTLHVFEELRGPELAQHLGINLDTAYSRIKAARRELAKALGELGIAGDEATLVAATRRSTTADERAPRRVAALLAVRLGTTASQVATGALAGFGTKGVLAAIALGATLTVVIAGRTTSPPRPIMTHGVAAQTATRSDAALRPAVLDEATPIPAELAAVPSPTDPTPPPPTTTRTTTTRTNDTSIDRQTDPLAAALAAEVALVTAAKTALDAGDPDTALARLADHARRFPDGQLANERGGYRAIALCDAGQTAAGRGEARVYLAAHPDAPLSTRVRRTCGVSSSTP